MGWASCCGGAWSPAAAATIGPVRFGTQTFAVLALPLIYLPTKTNLKLPKWFFYLFYPAHLACNLRRAERLLAR